MQKPILIPENPFPSESQLVDVADENPSRAPSDRPRSLTCTSCGTHHLRHATQIVTRAVFYALIITASDDHGTKGTNIKRGIDGKYSQAIN